MVVRGDVAGDGGDLRYRSELGLSGTEAVGTASVDGEGVSPRGELPRQRQTKALRRSCDDRDSLHCRVLPFR